MICSKTLFLILKLFSQVIFHEEKNQEKKKELASELQPIIEDLTNDFKIFEKSASTPNSPIRFEDTVAASDMKAIEVELLERENLIKSQNNKIEELENIQIQLESEKERLDKELENLTTEKEKLVEDLNQR